MKTRILQTLIVLALLVGSQSAFGLGSGFTYQGRLTDLGGPANGTYDLTFSVFDVSTGGIPVAGPVTNSAVAITNGLFTITLDFGTTVFNGNDRWLEIGVRTNGGGAFTALTPRRQQLTTVPYAVYSLAAGVANSISSTAVVQGQSLNIGTNNSLFGIYSTITGGDGNSISGTSSTISGGTANIVNSTQAAIGGGYHNFITGDFGTVAGGDFNYAGGDHSTVAGGQNNQATGTHAFVGGGYGNFANSDEDVVVGGMSNSVSGDPAFIGAGSNNKIGGLSQPGPTDPFLQNMGKSSWIASGNFNTVSADYSGIGGGYNNGIQTGADDSFIGGGLQNLIATALGNNTNNTTNVVITANVISGGSGNIISNATYSVIAGGSANRIPSGGNFATIGGGAQNNNSGPAAAIGGGQMNNIQSGAFYSTIAGGNNNSIQSFSSGPTIGAAIGGGANNYIAVSNNYTTISGGLSNQIYGPYGAIPGGDNNSAGTSSFAAGHRAKAYNQGDFVWADSQNSDFASTANNQFLIRATNGVAINTNNPSGYALNVNGPANISGSLNITGSYLVNGVAQSGVSQWINGSGSSIYYNNGNVGIGTASPTAKLDLRPIIYSDTQSGGIQLATTDGHWASGIFLRSNSGGQPRLALDSPNFGEALTVFGSNIGIGTTSPAWKLDVYGDINTSGNFRVGGTIVMSSDRNVKENFTTINTREVLAKVASLPLTEWNYKRDSKDVQHLGPMAQDFQAAFGLDGADDKHISVIDENGVALAAIQGLNQKLDEKDTEIQDLKQTVDELKKMVQSLAEKK
jgi:Chaperone of endosialidase